MKVVKDDSLFGGKLYNLFLAKGFDLEKGDMQDLLTDMVKKKIISLSEKDGTRKQISQDVKCTLKVPNIYTSQLKEYCDYLGCSADYLLGYINNPTHEITDISKATGLTSAACKELLKANDDKKIIYERIVSGGYIDTIVTALNSFFDIGAGVQINGEKVSDKNTISLLKKAVENIKGKALYDSGSAFMQKISHDKKVAKHFMDSRLNLYHKKSKALHQDNPSTLKIFEDNFSELKKDMLAVYDDLYEKK